MYRRKDTLLRAPLTKERYGARTTVHQNWNKLLYVYTSLVLVYPKGQAGPTVDTLSAWVGTLARAKEGVQYHDRG